MHRVTFKTTRGEELKARTIDEIMSRILLQEKLRARLGLITEDLLKYPNQNKKNPNTQKVMVEKKIRYFVSRLLNRRNQSQFSKTSQKVTTLENILKELGFTCFSKEIIPRKSHRINFYFIIVALRGQKRNDHALLTENIEVIPETKVHSHLKQNTSPLSHTMHHTCTKNWWALKADCRFTETWNTQLIFRAENLTDIMEKKILARSIAFREKQKQGHKSRLIKGR